MRIFIPIVMLLLALMLVIFGAQNTQAVNVRFLGIETGSISLALVIVVAAIFGALLTGLFGAWYRIRYGIQNWRAKKQQSSLAARNSELEQRISTLESENTTLRTTGPLAVAAPIEPSATSGSPENKEQKTKNSTHKVESK
jgi:uncharacterized integral membrane protein